MSDEKPKKPKWRKYLETGVVGAAGLVGLAGNAGCSNTRSLTVKDAQASGMPDVISDQVNAQFRDWGLVKMSWVDDDKRVHHAYVPTRIMAQIAEDVTGVKNLEKIDLQRAIECVKDPRFSKIRPVLENIATDVLEVNPEQVAQGFFHMVSKKIERAGFKLEFELVTANQVPQGAIAEVMEAIRQWRRSPEGIGFNPANYQVDRYDTQGAHILQSRKQFYKDF